MALTGIFLITFLVVHAGINAMIYFNDGGVTFNTWAHFMGTNLIISTMELVLFLGLILHVVDGLMLCPKQNRAAAALRTMPIRQAQCE
jgi:succinate dehydrogenase / fumarate reductase cytochrome b subunit